MKPPFRPPLMSEIRAVEPNGFRGISLFAGCGGSSLGYRTAGFKMLWASEFVGPAADTYAANADPSTVVDRRDVRKVSPGEILSASGLVRGELDLLDGSPPCASFSMAGKRANLWDAVKKYSETEQRVDDLFGEYLRILDGLRPKVAVAENVPGLTIGVARGFYNTIMEDFEDLGYVAEAAILEAEWLGVPQARHRLFFVAVRKDLADAGLRPAFPDPLPYCYSIADACPLIKGARVTARNSSNGFAAREIDEDLPAPSVRSTDGDWERRRGTNLTVELVEPETDISRFAIGAEWEKMGGPGRRAIDGSKIEGEAKFFQLVRPNPDEPCPTITATAASTGAASVVHPTEKRKFSVAELKRLCAFPDDFVLTGSYSQKVERLGRAVMPPVSRAIGATIASKILEPWRRRS